MTCRIHTAPQTWCPGCIAAFRETVTPGIDPKVRKTLTGSGVDALRLIEAKPSGPGCWEHWWTKDDCESCALYARDPKLRETLRRAVPSDPASDASAARIAGLEASVNEKRETIARLVTLSDRQAATILRLEGEARSAAALLSGVTDALRITGPHQGIDDHEILPAVRSYVDDRARRDVTYEATIAALQSQLASESREVLTAERDAARDKLRKVLVILTRIGGYLDQPDQHVLADARAEVA